MTLDINTKDDRQMKFISKMSKLKVKIPPIKKVCFSNFSGENLELREFMSECMPDRMEELVLNHKHGNLTPLDLYEHDFISLLPRVTKKVLIYKQVFSQRSLQSVFRGSANSD